MKKFVTLLIFTVLFLLQVGELYADININVNINKKPTKESKKNYPEYFNQIELIEAYMYAWEILNYQTMYHLLSHSAKDNITFAEFKNLLSEKTKVDGTVNTYKITKNKFANNSYVVSYKCTRASYRQVKAEAILVNQKGAWVIDKGNIIPYNMNYFNR